MRGRRKAVAMPALLACMSLLGCGGAGHGQRSATASAVRTAGSATTAGNGGFFGDYDRDDYVSGAGDADNDDSGQPKDRDGDVDNPTGSYYDSDDHRVRRYGHAASPAEARVIAALVKRYYTTAVAENGQAGCAMIASPLAKSVAETLGQTRGQPDLRGDTCATVMTKVYKLNHRQLSAYDATLEVSSVRLKRDGGVAILRFANLPGRQIAVTREDGQWKIQALIDSELP